MKTDKQTPSVIQQRLITEIEAAKKYNRKWQDNAAVILRAYLDDREIEKDNSFARTYRLNLFSANINTLRAMLYGNTPSIDVSRKHGDANDDVARVAAEVLQRVLEEDKTFAEAIGQSLEDRLLVGGGFARVRYTCEVEQIEHPEIPGWAPAWTEDRKTEESAPVDYVHWRDILWSPARTWGEVRWVGFRSYLDRDALVKRFGDKIGHEVPMSGEAKPFSGGHSDHDGHPPQPGNGDHQKAEIWEIWDKSKKQVYWMNPGMSVVCDARDDPLNLKDFFPCPRPMLANTTSAAYLPRADYLLAQDQYRQIDILTTRITLLTKAMRVTGTYDRAATGLQRMLTEASENELIPVDSWAAFAERGGIRGAVDWMPIDNIASVIQVLVGQRTEIINLLYQATGMSDILRGATTASETATAQSIKARFASVRVQHLQDEFARFAADLQRLRTEIIVANYDDETLVKQSGMARTHDAQLLPAALALLRDPEAGWRIDIESSAMAAQDLAALRAEKAEFIQGLSMFIGAALPMIEKHPSAAPALLEMLKWTMTGFRGSRTIEGVLDQAITAMKQQPPGGQKQDPEKAKQEAEMAKLQAESQATAEEIKLQSQADLMNIAAKSQAEMKTQAAQAMYETRRGVYDNDDIPPG